MAPSSKFLEKIVDSVSEQIGVIDDQGIILLTNTAWRAFGQKNGCAVVTDWVGVNYLSMWDDAATMGDDLGKQAAAGIRSVINGGESFNLEYPCHSPNEKRWFMMSATRFEHNRSNYTIISHRDITQRKLAEEYAASLCQVDGLTGVFNRRHFDEFLEQEWKRCARMQLPVTLAMIDIDHFRLLNDAYGHRYGDVCLMEISGILKTHAKRPGDICARYGDDEFVMVFGNSSIQLLLSIFDRILDEIRGLQLPHKESAAAGIVTVSAGATTMYPSRQVGAETLVRKADELLSVAKENGRNRIEYL